MRLFLLLINIYVALSAELMQLVDRTQCNETQYLNVETFQCEICDVQKFLVPSTDKLSCVCNPAVSISRPKSDNGFHPYCVPCEKNSSIPSSDQSTCIECDRTLPRNIFSFRELVPYCKSCMRDEIYMERYPNGTALRRLTCTKCAPGTIPSASKTTCIKCPIVNADSTTCRCANRTILIGDTCVPKSIENLWPNDEKSFRIQYENGKSIESSLFKNRLIPAIYFCTLQNLKMCQMVANLCALVLYKNYIGSPCRLWNDIRQTSFLPWLFYGEGDAFLVLNRKKINYQYTFKSTLPTSWLNISAIQYDLEGHFDGIVPIKFNTWNLCVNSNERDFRFGVNYVATCEIYLESLISNMENKFFAPHLQFVENNVTYLYAIPILVRTRDGYAGNMGNDMANWMLVRRFFLVDTILSRNTHSISDVIRYVKSIQLVVRVRSKAEGGKIFPPYFIVTYGEIGREDLVDGNEKVAFRFSVSYEMENRISYGIEVAIGTLCSLATVYSGIQTWSYCKRSGKISIDLGAIFRFLIFCCGNLANAFFVVASGVCIYAFIFYKWQSVVYFLLPNASVEMTIRNYIIVAFSLKIVEIVSMISQQISIDIFLIDWEKPRARDALPKNVMNPMSNKVNDNDQQPISIWRTYFIANEWNELQTKRKVNLTIHLVVTAFCFEVGDQLNLDTLSKASGYQLVEYKILFTQLAEGLFMILGVKNWAIADPDLNAFPEYQQYAPISVICFIAVGVIIYVLIYFAQLTVNVVIYERYIKNSVQDFVDLCSMANVSVFILMLERYGFYIHGRSVHGFADTDMASMLAQLQREEDNLCGHRGLISETDEQTFRMMIPLTLRNYYRKLMAPLLTSSLYSSAAMAAASRIPNLAVLTKSRSALNENMEKSIQAYKNINKFLIAFFEHAIKDIDYEVRAKLYAETFLDIEFTDSKDRGVLYLDNGHAFDNVLFYGNEFALGLFDLIVFTFVLMLTYNFLFAIFMTGLTYQIMATVRKIGGKRNLAKKTLIDNRFLI